MSVVICDMPPQQVGERLAALVSAYEAIFGMLPGSGAEFEAALRTHSAREGFRLCTAVDDTQILGFGYGYTGRAEQFWRDSLAAAMGPEATALWLTESFEFVEFGVVPSARRDGIGSAIYDVLFAGLPHERAVLTVVTTNTSARYFYERRGWNDLYHDFCPPSGHTPYIVMGSMLPGPEEP